MGGWVARNVTRSSDLDRVLALPRRTLTEADAEALVDEVTDVFITPLGRREGARLKPWQAAGIVDIANHRGGYLGYPVGIGKTLVALLAALVLEAKRPVLLTLAGLVKQTRDDWARYAKHWRIPSPPPRILTYEELTNEPKVDLLDRISPDLVICDEADVLRNPGSSMTKRLDRYRIAHWDDCDFVCMTGTPGRLSILDFWHLLIWSLRDNAPVPLNNSEAETWAAAIDEKVSRFGQRPGVGALRELGGEGATLVDRARDGFRKRLTETPGVIIVSKDSSDQPLTLRQVIAPHDPVIEQHFKRFREELETPGGERLSDPLSVYRHAGELGAGYYSVFDPPPPQAWRDARRAWHSFVGDVVEASCDTKRPLDTEAAVARAYPEAWQLKAWREIKGTYTIPSKPVWLSDSVVEYVLDYLAAADKRGEPTLAFCWSVPLCEALEYASAERARARKERPVPWYGRRGMTRSGHYIGQADKTRSAILSGQANLRGRNLQAFCRSLFVLPPQSARFLDQALANSEPVLTPSGWRPIGDVRVGDLVYGSDGQPTEVLEVLPQGLRPIYRLTFQGGTQIDATGDHLWSVSFAMRSGRVEGLITTEAMHAASLRAAGSKGECQFSVRPVAPVSYPDADLPIDPYTLGALIGDGSFVHESVTFTSMDADIVAKLRPPDGVELVPAGQSGRAMQYRFRKSAPATRAAVANCPHPNRPYAGRGMCGSCYNRERKGAEHKARRRAGIRRPPLTEGAANPLIRGLKSLGLWGHKADTKFIPEAYMRAPAPQRLELLRGILDTDGHASDSAGGAAEFSSVSGQLADQVAELAESLGGMVTRRRLVKRHWKGKPCLDQHVLRLVLPSTQAPFHCARKLERFQKWGRKRAIDRGVLSIELVGGAEATCIRVAAKDSLFVARGHILTHNCIGRTDRTGQDKPTHVDFLVSSGEGFDGFERALAEARFGKQTWNTAQKLLKATIERATPPQGTYRFARKTR